MFGGVIRFRRCVGCMNWARPFVRLCLRRDSLSPSLSFLRYRGQLYRLSRLRGVTILKLRLPPLASARRRWMTTLTLCLWVGGARRPIFLLPTPDIMGVQCQGILGVL